MLNHEMFEYFGEVDDVEQATLCVAFLLEWGTDAGNDALDPRASQGLGQILRVAARRLQRKRRRDRRAESSALRLTGTQWGFGEKMDSPYPGKARG
jgi:hypothetical protein